MISGTAKGRGMEQSTDRWVQRAARELWLYRRAMLAGLLFISLNAIDGCLTNFAQRIAGQAATVEANPFMQIAVGHFAFPLKGLIGIGAFVLLARVKKLSPDRLFNWLLFGCLVITLIIVWNLYAMGMIG